MPGSKPVDLREPAAGAGGVELAGERLVSPREAIFEDAFGHA